MKRRIDPKVGAATKFSAENQPANRGRPKGSRDKISADFLTDLAEVYGLHGREALLHVAKNEQATFVKALFALQPKELEIKTPESALTDDQLEAVYTALLARMSGTQSETKQTVN